jgi:hypothetical protein
MAIKPDGVEVEPETEQPPAADSSVIAIQPPGKGPGAGAGYGTGGDDPVVSHLDM